MHDGETPLALFPPVAAVPPPPRLGVDSRQAGSAQLIGRISELVTGDAEGGGPNLTTGYHASAVDIGKVQRALEDGLRRFDDTALEARWSDELAPWIRTVLRAWIQRVKMMRVERAGGGIRVELETQDDLGYYTYGFDVFPRRTGR